MGYVYLSIIPIGFLMYGLYKSGLTEKDWFKYAFTSNQWLWFHMLCAGVGTHLINFITQSNIITMLVVLVIVIGWEVIEYKMNGYKNYSNKKHWICDSISDIVCALVITLLCLI